MLNMRKKNLPCAPMAAEMAFGDDIDYGPH